MQCSSCGNVLSPGIRICPACGALAPVPPPVAPPYPARTTFAYDEQVPFTDRETPSVPPILPSSPLLSSASLLPAPPARTGETNAVSQPPPIISAPPSQRKQFNVLALVISIISVLIIGVLVFLLIRVSSANNGGSANKRASTTQTSPSSASDPQTLYNQVMSTKPTLDDAFSSNNSSSWILGTTAEGSICTVTSDTLHATAAQGNASLCVLATSNVSNFACQVQTTLTQGDTIGLVFRANTTTLNIYLLGINTQGAYILVSGQKGAAPAKTLSQGSSSALKIGYSQPNLLAVIAQGNTIYLYFNKQYIARVNDSTSSSGLLGIISSGSVTNVPVDATFSHFQFWNL